MNIISPVPENSRAVISFLTSALTQTYEEYNGRER